MTELGRELLAKEWITGQSGGGNPDSPTWRARENLMIAVIDLPFSRPEFAWDLIRRILSHTEDKRILGLLSASLLEDLLTYHGEDYIGKRSGNDVLTKVVA